MRLEFEVLEDRRLLSGSLNSVMSPNLTLTPLASSSFSGYTPAQIRHAYGFDLVNQNGAGQTVAIVDAYNDPNIASDLHVFDRKFGLADPPSFKKVSQAGGSTAGVANDSGWASEIALDVEWAHAMAPAANILLVEAKSANTSDLMAAVDYARRAAGVSVVSLSWGGSEFWSQTRYDSVFTTPAGHQGVTFVAAAGDSGGQYAPEWPASSPNVLGVGGTVLQTRKAIGRYYSEVAWAYNDGGVSSIESQPSYQNGAQKSGGRSSPDVAYNASIIYGFAVYSSVPDQGTVGWSNVGGTSAGAPQWAAIVALADQSRAARGLNTLDSRQGTLPALYSLYSSSKTYAATFHDTTNSSYWGASAGYDTVTGLGSPKVPAVISALTSAANVGTSTRRARIRAAAASPALTRFSITATSATTADVPVLPPMTASIIVPAAFESPVRSLGDPAPQHLPAASAPQQATWPALIGTSSARSVFSTVSVLEKNGRTRDLTAGAFAHADAPTVQGRNAVIAPPTIAEVAVQSASSAAPAISSLAFSQLASASLFADQMVAVAQESLLASAALSSKVIQDSRLSRIWSLVLAVTAVDAAVLGRYWWWKRRVARRGRA